MDINLFDFYLPEELIAQKPSDKRDHSRLLAINKETKTYEDRHFYDILDYLRPGDVLVRNNTKVLPARIFGFKEGTNAHVEILLLRQLEGDVWECLAGNARPIKIGSVISFGDGKLKAKCLEVKDEGIRIMEFMYQGIFLEILNEIGNMPLPPYIKKKLENGERYQTVYNKIPGSSAAPTAGLHFTTQLLEKIKNKGIIIEEVLLDVGLGTFRPVSEENIENHHMHSEKIVVKDDVAKRLNEYKAQGKRIIAVGTTSVRTLESATDENGIIHPVNKETNIFIYPGYKFKFVDSIITNFHLPESTLIMLISAFAGREETLKLYNLAVKEKYRFFSFGDSMFIQ